MPPDQLFLDDAEWQRRLAERRVVQLSPFAAPPEAPLAFDAGGRRGREFAEARANPNLNLFEAVRDALKAEQAAGRRTAIAAYSPGSAERLRTLLGEHGIQQDSAAGRQAFERRMEQRRLEEEPESAVSTW